MNDLSVEEALARILSVVAPLDYVEVALEEAAGSVLAADIVAPVSIPPFANAGMDGFAVRVSDLTSASRETPVTLPVLGAVAAGNANVPEVRPGGVVRIMTGAQVPPGTEAVIQIEEVVAQGQSVTFFAPVQAGRHIRPAGEDIAAGETAIPAGQLLRAQEIGMLAALGIVQVSVVRRPRVAIISTGDELVAAGEPLAPGKIRDSNGPALAAFVAAQSCTPLVMGIARDTADELRLRIHTALAQGADLIVTSAGASAGDFDVVRNTLDAEGGLQLWRVNMKPGRPLLFGRLGEARLIGLPGNPASALIVAELFLRPVLRKLRGLRDLGPTLVRAKLAEAQKGSPRRHFVRARLEAQGESWLALTRGIGTGSGALSTLVRSNALLILPEGTTELPAGSIVDAMILSE